MSDTTSGGRLQNRGLLLTLGLGAFSIGTDGLIITGLLEQIASGLNVSTPAAGQLITTFAVVYGLGAPAIATLLPRMDRKFVLLLGLAVLVAANLVSAAAPSYGVLMAARVFAALGSALYIPSAMVVAVGVASERHRGKAIAIVAGGLSSATALGVPLGTLIGSVGSWRITFLLVAALGGIALAVLATALPAVPAPAAVTIRQRLRVFTHPAIVVALLSYLLACAGEFTFMVYVAPAAADVTAVQGAGISVFLLINGVSAVGGSMLGGLAADRFGGTRAYAGAAVGLLTAMLVMALLALADAQQRWITIVIFAALLCLIGLSSWALSPAQSYRVSRIDTPDTTVALSLNGSASYLGLALGGALGGVAMGTGSASTLALTAAGLVVLALLTLVLTPLLLSRRPGRVRETRASR